MKRIALKGDERILVIRTDRIGDVILSLPTLELIKKKYPNCRLTMLVSPYTQTLLENNPYLDDLIIDDKDRVHRGIGGLLKLVRFLREKRLDICVLLHPTWRMAFLLFLAKIKYRIATGYRFYSFFFNVKVFQHRRTIEKHELEYNLDMLKPLGIEPERILPKIYLSTQEGERGKDLLGQLGISSDDLLVVVHAGSGKSSLNLSAEKFAIVADMLMERERAKVVLTGDGTELGLVNSVMKNMKQIPISLAGKLNLRELGLLLKRADLMLSNSTGPMHLATSVGTPVVAIFCPIFVASPKRWGPYGKNHQVVLPPVPICRKCKPTKCRYYNCMEKIDTDEIYLKIKSVLDKKKLVEKER